ncbi:MAG: endonuclease III domain-containing protein [Chloroflexi bacterium]|nr:endonuclease III domain-containing protein [Chloroflexota bacterium]
MEKGGLRARLQEVYDHLYGAYGPQGWWPAETPFEVCIGAILTQSAAWGNVEKALVNLKAAGVFSPSALRATPLERLAELVHPSGYFNAKARKIRAFAEHLGSRYQDDLDAMLAQDTAPLRQELLGIFGIGEETADDILLYAAGKPVFVVDAYTRRITQRLGLTPDTDSYDGFQKLFMRPLPPDPRLFNEYHALLVRHGKEVCRKEPLCQRCCLLELCRDGQSRVLGKSRAPKPRREATPQAPGLPAARAGGRSSQHREEQLGRRSQEGHPKQPPQHNA